MRVNLAFAVFSLVSLAPWAFVGFEVVTFDTEHFKFPVRKAKGVIVSSIVVAAVAYTLMALASVAVIPDGYGSWVHYIAELGKLHGVVSIPTFYAARRTMGPIGLGIIGATAMAAILTGIIGAYRAIVNLLSTMAGDKILSARFSKTRYCIFFIMGLSVLISLLGRNTLVWFIDLTAFGAIVAYGYTSLAAYKIARTKKNYRIMTMGVVGTVISVLFGVAQLVPRLVALDAMCSEAFLLLSLWCLLGFFFYWRMVKRSSLAEYSSMATSGLVLFTLLLYTALMWLGKLLIGKPTLPEMRHTLIAGGSELMAIIFVGLMVMLYIQNRVSKMHEAAKREKIRSSEISLARSEFLLNVSHDIRTPMNAILGFTTLALKEPDYMLRDYLKKIEKSGRELQAVLDNILEMSRIESEKQERELLPTDLSLSFEELNLDFAEAMKEKRIDFAVNTSIRNRHVWCDSPSLRQALSAIVADFRRATPVGGTISVFADETGDGANGYSAYELHFQHSGVDSSGEVDPKAPAAGTPDPAGAESAFAAARDLAERMDGTAEQISSPGNGTEIVIRLTFRLAGKKDMKRGIAASRAADR